MREQPYHINARITILVLVVLLTCHVSTISSAVFPPSRSAAPNFSSSRLYDASRYLRLNDIDGRAGCLADVNKDKYTDMIVIGCASKCIKFFVWVHSTWSFKLYEEATIYLPENSENVTTIEDISAADFNYDGLTDLLVTTTIESTASGETYKYRQLLIFIARSTLKYTEPPIVIETHDQVAVVDINGDMRVDLFGETSNRTRTFWVNQAPKKKEDTFSFLQVTQTSETEQLLPLAFPATTIFIDIDGDCSADLFIISCSDDGYEETFEQLCKNQVYEIWLNRDGKYKLHTSITAPLGAGRPVFNDYDRDGDNDLVIPVCYPADTCAEKNEILILINTQPLRPVAKLCSIQDFDFTKSSTFPFPENKRMAQHMRTNSGKYFPGTIRAGDYNLDGYTDLVLPVLEISEGPKYKLKIDLWRNVPCDKTMTGCVSRGFMVQADGVDDLPSFDVSNPLEVPSYNAFFMDLDESGVMDIMTTMQNSVNESISGYYNNYFNDAYFLKTISLNGAKESGALMPGMTFKFTVSDLQGVKHRRVATQITQTTYSGLQPPYHLFGLGRTNGYIEEFFFGKPKESSAANYQYNTGVIPNSQLVAVPYPPSSPKKWQLELYVSPSSHTLWVALAVFSTLVLIGLPIIGLWRWEIYKDNKAKSSSKMSVPSTSLLMG